MKKLLREREKTIIMKEEEEKEEVNINWNELWIKDIPARDWLVTVKNQNPNLVIGK